MNANKQRAFNAHRQLIKDGYFNSAARLYRALLNGFSFLKIGLSDTDWIVGKYLCDNNYTFVKIND